MPKQDLFKPQTKSVKKYVPLAVRMRPKSLNEFIGQKHILGEGKLLKRAIVADRISSLILYGPPGCGKTTLGFIIKDITQASFTRLNAAISNIAEVKQVIAQARFDKDSRAKKTVLFVDEIHHFNKSQQDVLMPDVEEGNIILVGTTIYNPFFSVISPLLSRSLAVELKPLSQNDILLILKRALADKKRGLGNYRVKISPETLMHLAKLAEGDARRALNALEIGVLTTAPNKEGDILFSLKVAEESIQKKVVVYDKAGDGHYDTISAFIKSMRGSDPDAVLYWLAKMLYAGEDPRFIARRIVIAASEDVGNADPQALSVAVSAFQAVEFIGMPEAKIPLAQAAVYVACAPKSNAAYMGIERALEDVEKQTTQEVPKHLKDAHYPGAEKLGRGKDYKYPHVFKNHYVEQKYMPEAKTYYSPSNSGYEKKIKEWLVRLKEGKI